MRRPNSGWQAWDEAARTVELSADFWDKVDTGFEVRLGQVNEWTIPLPDELIEAVRAAIKADATDKAKPAGPSAPGHGN
jgi:hypothetical protein